MHLLEAGERRSGDGGVHDVLVTAGADHDVTGGAAIDVLGAAVGDDDAVGRAVIVLHAAGDGRVVGAVPPASIMMTVPGPTAVAPDTTPPLATSSVPEATM